MKYLSSIAIGLVSIVLLPSLYYIHEYVTTRWYNTVLVPQYEPPVYWSTYRPGLYYGVRASHPASPLLGLTWYSAAQEHPLHFHQHMRHWAEERDHVDRWGYTEHDGYKYGYQYIDDSSISAINLTTIYLHDKTTGHVITRISGQRVKEDGDAAASIIWYVALDSKDTNQQISLNEDSYTDDDTGIDDEIDEGVEEGLTSSEKNFKVYIRTGDTSLGDYILEFQQFSNNSHPVRKTFRFSKQSKEVSYNDVYYAGIHVPSKEDGTNDAWRAKEYIQSLLTDQFRILSHHQSQRMQKYYQRHPSKQPKTAEQYQIDSIPSMLPTLQNSTQPDTNLLAIQYIVNLPFTIDILLKPKQEKHSVTAIASSDTILHSIKENSNEYQTWFHHQFPSIKQKYGDKDPSYSSFASYMLSNLLGGYGYFYGGSIVALPSPNNSSEEITVHTPPTSLLSTVPARSFFPRGFLWDEGFHELLVSQWNLTQSLQIYSSWLSKVDGKTGWQPREQILGEESRARVPAEFQAQRKYIANPPTLILTLGRISKRIHDHGSNAEKQLFVQLLHTYLPTINKHVEWYFHTQYSHIDKNGDVTSVAWRGRTAGHCLASGFDDYPRASFIPEYSNQNLYNATKSKEEQQRMKFVADDIRGIEGHVDLHAWMIALSNTMITLANYALQYRQLHKPRQHGNDVKSDENDKDRELYERYISAYQHRSSRLYNTLNRLHWDDQQQSYADYHIDEQGKLVHEVHVGYVSIVPLLLGLVEVNSIQFKSILQQITDADQLHTAYGLRSLSARDAFYETGENYWRGNIWINMNYMTVVALKHYATLSQAHNHYADTPLSHITHTVASGHKAAASTATVVSDDLHQHIVKSYNTLRKSLIKNVYRNWLRTGFVYEQYDNNDGRGKRTFPFTGWTTLVLLLMSETY